MVRIRIDSRAMILPLSKAGGVNAGPYSQDSLDACVRIERSKLTLKQNFEFAAVILFCAR
ncbi:hypothetical protein ABIC03_003464 [Bradyrhizobium sp. RT6a]